MEAQKTRAVARSRSTKLKRASTLSSRSISLRPTARAFGSEWSLTTVAKAFATSAGLVLVAETRTNIEPGVTRTRGAYSWAGTSPRNTTLPHWCWSTRYCGGREASAESTPALEAEGEGEGGRGFNKCKQRGHTNTGGNLENGFERG